MESQWRGSGALAGMNEDTDNAMTAVAGGLISKSLTLAIMESCTGGQLASAVTRTEGCGDFFLGGVVAYATASKIAVGVSPQVIEAFGVVSSQTAAEMAAAIRRLLNADVGVGITGVAGPSTQEGKPPGTVFVSIATAEAAQTKSLRLDGEPDAVKKGAVLEALRWLAHDFSLPERT
jgi:PncC family amidohydrolase